MCMDFIFSFRRMLGVTFSMDEITMTFKVHHAEKRMMTLKSERGRLHTDALFQKIEK